MSVKLTIAVLTKFDDIDALSKAADRKVKQIIADDAQKSKADAMARSRVDTGLMRRSWTAFNLTPYQYELRNDVPYTVHNEYGTIFMSAQPMATPAAEAARQRLPGELAKAFER